MLTHNKTRETVHFLHIGKNAGTQFKNCAAQVNAFSFTHFFMNHTHLVKLDMLPEKVPYTFVTRDPVKRFRSGFYSRKRKGLPRIFVEWRPKEAWAFGEFEHANDIAEVLYDDTSRGKDARKAMGAIRHVCNHQHHWFENVPNFLEVRPPVFILRQESFDADMLKLYDLLGIAEKPIMGEDKTRSHKNDYSETTPLSDKSVENLKKWFEKDFEFLDRCGEWRNKNFGDA